MTLLKRLAIFRKKIGFLPDYDEAGFLLELKSNGTLLNNKLITELSKIKFLDFQISIYDVVDGYSPLTDSNYSHTKMKENIKMMIDLGIPCTLSVLVGKHNIDFLDMIHEDLSSISEKINVFYSYYITPSRAGSGREIDFRLSYDELEKKLKPFLLKTGKFQKLTKYRSCNDNTVCFAGCDQIAIDPGGNVYPCLDLRVPFGNIFQEKLKTVLSRRREIMSTFKFSEIKKCVSCDLKEYCDSCVGVALLENGDYRKPSTHKCDVVRFNSNW